MDDDGDAVLVMIIYVAVLAAAGLLAVVVAGLYGT